MSEAKAKEMFAYLVHKQTAAPAPQERYSPYFSRTSLMTKKAQNLMQTYIYALKKSLKNVGAEEALIHTYNAFAVDPKVLDCDYYRFKELDVSAVNSFQNEFMSQYSWADFLYDEDLAP